MEVEPQRLFAAREPNPPRDHATILVAQLTSYYRFFDAKRHAVCLNLDSDGRRQRALSNETRGFFTFGLASGHITITGE